MLVMNRKGQGLERRIGLCPTGKPRHLLNIVLQETRGLLKQLRRNVDVVFMPFRSLPCDNFETEGADVVWETIVLKGPKHRQEVLQLLAQERR